MACELADDKPVLAAGGIHDGGGVRRALAAGAAGVVCGTRFLLTEECAAHPLYKQRVLGAELTIDTLLFGFGWSARHRAVPKRPSRPHAAKPDFAVQLRPSDVSLALPELRGAERGQRFGVSRGPSRHRPLGRLPSVR